MGFSGRERGVRTGEAELAACGARSGMSGCFLGAENMRVSEHIRRFFDGERGLVTLPSYEAHFFFELEFITSTGDPPGKDLLRQPGSGSPSKISIRNLRVRRP